VITHHQSPDDGRLGSAPSADPRRCRLPVSGREPDNCGLVGVRPVQHRRRRHADLRSPGTSCAHQKRRRPHAPKSVEDVGADRLLRLALTIRLEHGAGRSGRRRSNPLAASRRPRARRRRPGGVASGVSGIPTIPSRTKEGNPPRRIPFPLTAALSIGRAGRFYDRTVDRAVTGRPS
jgi:hypothetical protein